MTEKPINFNIEPYNLCYFQKRCILALLQAASRGFTYGNVDAEVSLSWVFRLGVYLLFFLPNNSCGGVFIFSTDLLIN